MGATWIEKHFTTNSQLEGFDHKYAMEPDALKGYVESIRGIEKSIQHHPVKIGEAEAYTRQRARRGLYASRNISAGQVIASEDIVIVRPENNMPADSIDRIIGKRIRADVAANDPIEPSYFEA